MMKQLKILFAGLGNAGKTSILRVLDDNLEVIPKLVPTPGIEYNHYQFMGFDVSIWDAGGQSSYRSYYIKDSKKYFEATDLLFYVVDVQDTAVYGESVAYFKEILGALEKLNLNDTHIVVFLHKNDPHLQNRLANLDKDIAVLERDLQHLLVKFSHAIYKTSIYESHTLFMAFSEGILHRLPRSSELHAKVQEIGQEFKSPAAILLTSKGYIYGTWHEASFQSDNLNKFNRSVIYLAHLVYEKIYPEFIEISLTEKSDIAAIIFPLKDQLFIFGVLVPKQGDIQQIRHDLLKKREELLGILQGVL
jgi:small GTP-binding protein